MARVMSLVFMTFMLVPVLAPNIGQLILMFASWRAIFIVLAVIGIIYGALVAMVQPDVKRLVAYSSVSHMGFVILGMFSFTEFGMQGALCRYWAWK